MIVAHGPVLESVPPYVCALADERMLYPQLILVLKLGAKPSAVASFTHGAPGSPEMVRVAFDQRMPPSTMSLAFVVVIESVGEADAPLLMTAASKGLVAAPAISQNSYEIEPLTVELTTKALMPTAGAAAKSHASITALFEGVGEVARLVHVPPPDTEAAGVLIARTVVISTSSEPA